jgi:hypothetical protein
MGSVYPMGSAPAEPAPPLISRILFTPRAQAVGTCALLVLNAIPVIGFLLYILSNSTNVPILDTWGFVPALYAFVVHGHVSLSSLWAPDGSARPVLWRILMLVVAKDFHFNVQLIKVLAVPCAVLELSVCYWAVRRTLGNGRTWQGLLLLLPITSILFGWSNWETILEEWNVQNIAAVAFALIAIMSVACIFAAANSRSKMLLALGIVCCLIASLLGEPGLLSWPACLVVSFFPWVRGRIVQRSCLVLAALVFFAIYLPGTASTPIQYDLLHLGSVIEFAVAALGNGILGMVDNQPALGVALAFGILQVVLCLAAMIVVLRTTPARREPYRIYIGLIAFGLGGALSIALARLDFGLATASSSRYVVTTAPTIIGLYLLCVRVYLDAHALHHRTSATRPIRPEGPGYVIVADDERPHTERRKETAFGSLGVIAALTMLLASGFADVDQYHFGSERNAYFTSLEDYACHASSATDGQLELFQYDPSGGEPGLDLLRVAIGELYEARLSVFSGTTCATLPSTGNVGTPIATPVATATPKATATTDVATAITATSATLSGTVNDNGLYANGGGTSEWYIRISASANGSSPTLFGENGFTGAASPSGTLRGLEHNTTYYFQVSVSNSHGTVDGAWVGFTTTG